MADTVVLVKPFHSRDRREAKRVTRVALGGRKGRHLSRAGRMLRMTRYFMKQNYVFTWWIFPAWHPRYEHRS